MAAGRGCGPSRRGRSSPVTHARGPEGMQVTLVSHYGTKPRPLAALIRHCQGLLSDSLAGRFAPYGLHQVHATLIGLEGHRDGARIVNRNATELGAPGEMDPDGLLRFLREELAPIEVRVGGFRPGRDYGFESRGGPPAERSFSIQGDTAVAMGWPFREGAYCDAINELRWTLFRRFGVRHRWHLEEGAADNDVYFVLGHLDSRGADAAELRRAAAEMRTYLSGLEGLSLSIGRESLRVVAYEDKRLPPKTCKAWALDDPDLTPERLRALYPPLD